MKLNDKDKAIVCMAQLALTWIQQENEIQWTTASMFGSWENIEECPRDFLCGLINNLYEKVYFRVKPKKIWMKTIVSDTTDQEEVANKWKQDGYSVIETSG